MTIAFSCEACKRKIKAPDKSGGKYGKCPSCGHRCYVPLPKSDEEEEIRLAPLDESEETNYGQMMKETHSLTTKILHEKQEPEAGGETQQVSQREIVAKIVKYLRLMADGRMDIAGQTAKEIAKFGPPAKDVLDKMATTEIPEPELQDIPPQVQAGYIRQLRSNL